MLPDTPDRVPEHSPRSANKAIEQQTLQQLGRYSSEPALIPSRLKKLDEEWDIERVLEMNASALAFIGTALGGAISPWFLIIPLLVTLFLFQHALQGWCPPLPILRYIGFRTTREIDSERTALKAIRGDFDSLDADHSNTTSRVQRAFQAAMY